MSQAKQKVILITGSNSGIGHATAKKAVEAGHIVYGGARRQDTFPAIKTLGAHPLCIDVTDEASMIEAVRYVEAQHGAVDVLVNNAGFGQMGAIEDITNEQWLRQYETNVFGLVRMTQLVLPKMRQQKSGNIINISSAGGEFTFPLAGAYHSTKYAVESISDALRLEVKQFGIKVVLIQPGPVLTPLAHSSAQSLTVTPDNPYSDMMQAFHKMSQQTTGYIMPERVASVIVKVMGASNPRPRYKVGMMGHMMPLFRTVFSAWLWDRFVGSFYR
ncbi:MAG: SDR family NAD(P)-dependent oxidoreductase [Aggregatilineales bacterium]